MTNIVVLIKQVPDTWSERKLSDGDFTLDREAADAVLDEINERAVEEALLIKEREGGDSTVTVLTAGPERLVILVDYDPVRRSPIYKSVYYGIRRVLFWRDRRLIARLRRG